MIRARKLTKAPRAARRERIATACLQGLLADSECDGTPAKFARVAVAFADALIAELDK